MKMSILDYVATVLVIVGGINWGLVGALDFNLVAALFGAGTMVANVVYMLVGVAALYMVYRLFVGCGCKSAE